MQDNQRLESKTRTFGPKTSGVVKTLPEVKKLHNKTKKENFDATDKQSQFLKTIRLKIEYFKFIFREEMTKIKDEGIAPSIFLGGK